MKLNQPWIPIAKIQEIVQLEPVLVMVGLSLVAWLVYKVFLRGVSQERHRNLTGLFRNLLLHLAATLTFFILYVSLNPYAAESPALERLNSYIGLSSLLWGTLVFVKIARILLFEYLFILHMKVGVPLLLVNIFTLILSLVLYGWVATEVFSVKLTPLLATSAIFSLVLGLALQDTLGNLFAGIALQFDKPYEIGDWVEIQNGGQKWVGLVNEISWRATVLIGFGDETITVSNRVMAQSEISNFSAKFRPFVRTQVFRIPYTAPIARAKEIISLAALATPGVRKDPIPFVNVTELNENWIALKLIYSIDSYGSQYVIGDRILTSSLDGLEKAGYKLASSRIEIVKN